MNISPALRRHAIDFIAAVAGRRVSDLPEPIITQTARAISRADEIESSARDPLGNWEPALRDPRWDPRTPRIDEAILSLIRNAKSDQWPGGSQFALMLSHDVDMVSGKGHARQFVRRLRRALLAEGERSLALTAALGSLIRIVQRVGRSDPLGGFERWIHLEQKYGFSSTWYFLPERYLRIHGRDMDYRYRDRVRFDGGTVSVADMMRSIRASGAEIGLHGSFLSAEDGRLLGDQKSQVEDIIGAPVVSVRQHYLRYDSLKTPHLHEKAGFVTDSTLGYNKAAGFRCETSFPFRPWIWAENRPSSVLELPLALMDGTLLSETGSTDSALSLAMRIMDAVERVGGVLVLNWHPNYLNVEPFWNTYSQLLAEASRRDAWSCTASGLASWWENAQRSTTFEDYAEPSSGAGANGGLS